MARAEAYLRAKFRLDLSNRLATIHQRHRQTGQRTDSIGRTVLQTVAQKCLYLTLHAIYSDACRYYSKVTLTLYTRQSLCMFAYSSMCVRDYVFRLLGDQNDSA